MPQTKTNARTFKTVSFCILFLMGFHSFSQSIKGRVTDALTGEPLTGATVSLEEGKHMAVVKLDGRFIISNISPGTHKLSITYEGYISMQMEISVSENGSKNVEVGLEPTSKELSSIVISSINNDKDKLARTLERRSDPLLNVLSSRTIQLLPDITVANALQRVSGVTIEKSSSGEARYPIIRGMEKRYINTLVNGVKIPSPDNKNRFIPLDLFPAELLDRLEVSKSLTPSMEGDAIGGTINLVMKDAPLNKLLQMNFAFGYNSILNQQPYQRFDNSSMNKKSPAEINGRNYIAVPKDFSSAHLNYANKPSPINSTFGVTFGNRFGNDKKYGFIISGSYQNVYRGTTSNFFLPNSQPGLNNIPLFSDLQLRKYSVQSRRIGLNGKFDYRVNERNKISITTTFVRLDDYQTRIVYDTVALNSLVNNWQRSTWQYQSIYNTTLQGMHKLSSSFKLDWSMVYSSANNHIPDQSQFIHQYPIVATTLTADKLQSMSRLWAHNNDKDEAAYVNIGKIFKLLDKSFELKIGALLRNKDRSNFYNSYSLDPTLGELYSNINSAVFIFNPSSSGAPNLNGNNYTFNEKITAGYLQARWQLTHNLELLGGMRVEYTHQHYETELSQDVDARSGTIKYTDVLPGVQFKYAINKSQALRLVYYRALARPGFAELIPDGPDGEFFREIGDPKNLNHTVDDNLDLRYELFSGGADQVLLGVFYKNIQDPIEISAVKPLNVNSLYLEPVNIGRATNYGFEAVATKYFGVFGVSANYTYTKSAITNNNLIYSSRNSTGALVSTRVSETRPLQGQSNHIGNLSLIYKNPKIGFDLQTAVVYTGERISFISPYLGLNYWQAPTTQIDLSFEKKLVKKLTIYGKINNITNAPFELSLHQSYDTYLKTSGSRALSLQSDPHSKIIIQKDYYKTSYLFGFRYKL